MKLVGIISTAVLSLTLGVAAPMFAQQEQRDQQDEKKAQPEKSAKEEQKPAAQHEKNTKQAERKTRSSKRRTLTSRQRRTHSSSTHSLDSKRSAPVAMVAAAFPTTVSRPILDGNTRSMSAKPITVGIAASNTGAIGSDSLTHGQATGSTRKTFLSSKLTACITCATQCILASTLHSSSHHSSPHDVA